MLKLEESFRLLQYEPYEFEKILFNYAEYNQWDYVIVLVREIRDLRHRFEKSIKYKKDKDKWDVLNRRSIPGAGYDGYLSRLAGKILHPNQTKPHQKLHASYDNALEAFNFTLDRLLKTIEIKKWMLKIP